MHLASQIKNSYLICLLIVASIILTPNRKTCLYESMHVLCTCISSKFNLIRNITWLENLSTLNIETVVCLQGSRLECDGIKCDYDLP